MKTMLLLAMIFFSSSCSSTIVLRDFNHRVYYPCETWQTEKPVGKFCYHYCIKWKFLHEHLSENCIRWASDVQDLTDPATFEKFRAAGFKLGA